MQAGSNTAAAFNAGVNSIATQGVLVAAGLQEKFSWKSVAASAVSAAVSNQISTSLQGAPIRDGAGKLTTGADGQILRTNTAFANYNAGAARVTSDFISGITGAYIRHGITDSQINFRDAAAESVGNAIGNEIVGGLIRKEETSKAIAEKYGFADEPAPATGLRADPTNFGPRYSFDDSNYEHTNYNLIDADESAPRLPFNRGAPAAPNDFLAQNTDSGFAAGAEYGVNEGFDLPFVRPGGLVAANDIEPGDIRSLLAPRRSDTSPSRHEISARPSAEAERAAIETTRLNQSKFTSSVIPLFGGLGSLDRISGGNADSADAANLFAAQLFGAVGGGRATRISSVPRVRLPNSSTDIEFLTGAGPGFKFPPSIATNAAQPEVGLNRNQLQHGFKHAEDFGILGNANNKSIAEFSSAIQNHVNAPNTQAIQGTYRGQTVTHFVDPSSGLNVIRDSSGNFLSGWKLSPKQLEYVLSTGKLGGGK